MRKTAEVIYRLRYILASCVLVLTIFFGLSIHGKLDNTITAWFSRDDPVYVAYSRFRDTFEGDRYLIVAIKSDRIFSMDVLNYIKRKTSELKDLPQVKKVHSLANSNKVIGTEQGIEINPLLENLKKERLQNIKHYTMNDKLFRGYLISTDGMITSIIIAFDEMDTHEMDMVIPKVKKILNTGKPKGVSIYLTGDVMWNYEFNDITRQDETVLPVLGIILAVLVSFFLFRSILKVSIVLMGVLMTLTWSIGLYCLLGYSFNAITGMIVPLVTILSVANSLHIIEYFDEVSEKLDKKESFVSTLEYIMVPCFVASLTTSLGLASLITSPIGAIKHFGVSAGAGIMFSFIIAIILVPLMLIVFPSSKSAHHEHWRKFLAHLAEFTIRGYRYILVAAVVAIAFFGYGFTKIRIETNELNWFPESSDLYKSSMLVDKKLAGSGDLEIFIQGDEGILKDPDIMKRMDLLSQELKKMPHVKKVISLANYVKKVNKVLQGDRPEEYRVPDSRSLIAQELLLFSFSTDGREELESFASPDYSKGRISVKLGYTSSEEVEALSRLIDKKAKEIFSGTDAKVTLTGISYIFSTLNSYIIQSQISSFTLAFVLVIGIIYLVFRSVRYGTLSILPNIFPIIVVLGFMGLAGITLNVGTVMIASVALGICVDDTIHFLMRFRKEFDRSTLNVPDAIRKSTLMVGRAIISTSIITISGFMTTVISEFKPTKEFGWLMSLTLFLAILGDLLILPSSMLKVREMLIRGREKSISKKAIDPYGSESPDSTTVVE